jgi:hypothetical protein
MFEAFHARRSSTAAVSLKLSKRLYSGHVFTQLIEKMFRSSGCVTLRGQNPPQKRNKWLI